MSGPLTYLETILYSIPGFALGSVIHELGHAAIALRCGDPTPAHDGRMTLDPRRNLDPIGTTALLIAGVGWGRPVILDPVHLRSRGQRVAVAAAGPLAHLLVAAIFAIAIRVELLGSNIDPAGFDTLVQLNLQGIVFGVLLQGFLINIALCILNALPLPGLDGYAVLRSLLFPRGAAIFLRAEDYRYALYAVALLAAVVLPQASMGALNPISALTVGTATALFDHAVIPGVAPLFVGLPNLFLLSS